MASDYDFKLIDPIICNNNLKLSIQASEKHYCKPKNNEGPYTHVEVCSYDLKIPYWPDPICLYNTYTGRPQTATYYDVPSKAVIDLIYDSGGIKNGKLPELVL